MEQGLKERLEAIVGREIELFWEHELLAMQSGVDKREAHRLIEQHTRVVSIAGVLSGREKPTGSLCFFISESRGGLLVQLLESLKS
jgi:hypothetical protein